MKPLRLAAPITHCSLREAPDRYQKILREPDGCHWMNSRAELFKCFSLDVGVGTLWWGASLLC